MRRCTIIIPVYNAFAETLLCIRSVLQSTRPPYRLLVVDDASPQGELAAFLPNDMRRHPLLQLCRNRQNMGFVKTCNWAMRQTAPDDVVLLNSDTEVTTGWLERLTMAAYSRAEVGSVTPLTSNGEIASIPRFLKENPIPAGYSLEQFAELVSNVAAREYVEIPTCVGFCTFLKREMLDRVGLFDEESFGLGYGEENDLSCRAQQAGFVDILDDSTYIYHKGRTSFQGHKLELSRRNLAILEQKHPGYQQRIHDFALRNPLREVHHRIEEAMLRRWRGGARFSVLHVLHKQPFTRANENLPGGIEYHVADLVNHVPDAAHWSLYAEQNAYCLEAHVPGLEFVRRFSRGDFDLTRVIDPQLFDVIHLHHASVYPYTGLAKALARHGRYFVSLHDYWMCCSNINLVTTEGQACPALQCSGLCGVASHDVQRRRATTTRLLKQASAVFHFSQATRNDYAKRLGDGFAWQLLPHGARRADDHRPVSLTGDASGENRAAAEQATPPAVAPGHGRPLKVAFLGGIGKVKGAGVVRALAQHRSLPSGVTVEWHLIGLYDGTLDANVIDHGRYERADLPRILGDVAPDLVLIPSICPETYCYTLDEALSCGIPVVVTPHGAPPERVVQHGCGWVLSSLEPAEILATLDRIAGDWDAYESARRRASEYVTPDVAKVAMEYQNRYAESCRGVGQSDVEELIARLAELQKGYPVRVSLSRRIAGHAVNAGLILLDTIRARSLAARLARRMLPLRAREWIEQGRLAAVQGGNR